MKKRNNKRQHINVKKVVDEYWTELLNSKIKMIDP